MLLNFLKDKIRPYYYRWIICPKAKRRIKKRINYIKARGHANVVFFAANVPMWRYQGVYNIMSKDERFKVHIIIAPLKYYSEEQVKENVKDLKSYFHSRNMCFLDSSQWETKQFNIRESLDPDILFYTQPYDSLYGNHLDSNYYKDRLFAYISYSQGTVLESWGVNTYFQNIAWKLFYDSEAFRKEAIRLMYNRGENVVVAGNPSADDFLSNNHRDVWKSQNTRKKRVIWAPHFSIESGQVLNRGSFLWLWKEMLEIADEYRECVQFAFKPHPRLRTALYKCPDWGKERTEDYYRQWQELDNGQFEDSEYIDLFMTSDAMIHDCGSFTCEYHYTHNPVLFTTKSASDVKKRLKGLGVAAFEAHYLGSAKDDVKRFLDEVVLKGNDPMRSKREAFFNQYLIPPFGKTVGENVYNEIVKSIWG